MRPKEKRKREESSIRIFAVAILVLLVLAYFLSWRMENRAGTGFSVKMNNGSETEVPARKTKRTNQVLQDSAKVTEDIYVEKYNMDLTLDTVAHSLSGSVKMKVTNHSSIPLDKICVRNYAADVDDTGYILSDVKEDSQNKCLRVKKGKVSSSHYFEFSKKMQPEESRTISFRYQICIPKSKARFGYCVKENRQEYHLGFCFPFLATYSKGKWNETPYLDVWESRSSKISDYTVRFHAPQQYLVIGSGTEKKSGDTTVLEGKSLRDMSIVVSNGLKKKSTKAGQVTLNYYYPFSIEGEEYISHMFETLTDSFNLYSETFGTYPYNELDLVQISGKRAMEYSQLITVPLPDIGSLKKLNTSASFYDSCLSIAHEVAHQWFYAVIGNDEYKEPWLDEAFAEYCENFLYTRSGLPSIAKCASHDGKENPDTLFTCNLSDKEWREYTSQVIGQSQKNKGIHHPVDSYGREEYSLMVYDNGSYFLYEIQRQLGTKTFYEMMKSYYKTYCFKEVTGVDFLALVNSYDDSPEMKAIIHRYMK